jgi:hypothetical protein
MRIAMPSKKHHYRVLLVAVLGLLSLMVRAYTAFRGLSGALAPGR